MDPIQKLPNSTPIHMLAVQDHFHEKMRNFRQNVCDLPNIDKAGQELKNGQIQGLIAQKLQTWAE